VALALAAPRGKTGPVSMRTIEVARDFSTTPGGRFRIMGPKSGEAFRELLEKALTAKPPEVVEVVLDGVEGYGSSFLEEAFGGLIRDQRVSAADALERLRIVARSAAYRTYADEARLYMLAAADKLRN
jgi:hypothetical protein